MNPEASTQDGGAWAWAKLFALAALPLLGFWAYGLFDLDEGFYASVVAEMNRRGEWITPYFNGQPWFEKPILLYWAVKPSLAIFGGEFGLRLPSVLATLGTYAVCAWFASRRLSLRAGQWTVIILGSSLLLVGLGRLVMTDALLTFCLTAAMLTFMESLLGDSRWRLASAFFLGLSVLAKGPVGCLLLLATLGLVLWRERELRSAFRGWWGVGALIFGAVVASWYLPAYLIDRDLFVQEFLVRQNLQRFAGGDAAHTLRGVASWVFYVPILLVGMFPWSLWLWAGVRGKGLGVRGKKDQSFGLSGEPETLGSPFPSSQNPDPRPQTLLCRRFLFAWALVVFAFFTISGAKLPHYILPAVPPLGMLVAAHFARREQGGARPLIPFGAWTTTVVMAIVANVGMWTWYHGLLPGSADQSEIHAMAREIGADLRSPGESVDAGRVAIYKMGRQNRDLGTGGLKVQETDLPSLMFYLGCKATKTDRFEDLLGRQKDPLYILTRDSRIGSEEERLTQRWGGHLSPTVNGAYYSEWVLTPPGWVGAK